MTRLGSLVLALVAAVLVATLAACGGGSADRARPVQHGKAAVPSAARALPKVALPTVKKPNILVVETDDMRYDELRFMPTVRKLIGGRGLTFVNSFAPYPLCCPSRASFLSGKYTHNHHVYTVDDPYAFQSFDDKTTIATELQKAGYQTGLNGKYLNGYGRQHQYRSTKPSLHYVPPGWTDFKAGTDHGFGAGSPLRGGTYSYFSMTQNENGRIVPHQGEYSTYLLGDQTRGMIRRFGKTGKPWFIWNTPVAPHFGNPREPDDPRPVTDDHGHRYRIGTPGRPVWVRDFFDNLIDHPGGEPKYGPAEADVQDKPKFIRRLPNTNEQEKQAITNSSRQRAQALYVVDRQLARTLVTLKKTKQWKRTIVVFTSDNGYFLGEHRKRQGKILAYEPSLRVPFMMAGPGVPHGVRYDPITTVDLAPTFAAYAGLTGMPGADGRSMRPTIEKGDQGWRAPVITEGVMGDSGYLGNFSQPDFKSPLNTRGIRTARWKLVKYSSGETELYDLERDPLELQSLQGNPRYARVQAELTRLWEKYRNCKGAACDAPLPAAFRVSAVEVQKITGQEYRRNAQYYDHPFIMR